MDDYISREAASDLLAMALIDDWEPEYAQDRLSEIPAADVRPVVRGNGIGTVTDMIGVVVIVFILLTTILTRMTYIKCRLSRFAHTAAQRWTEV